MTHYFNYVQHPTMKIKAMADQNFYRNDIYLKQPILLNEYGRKVDQICGVIVNYKTEKETTIINGALHTYDVLTEFTIVPGFYMKQWRDELSQTKKRKVETTIAVPNVQFMRLYAG